MDAMPVQGARESQRHHLQRKDASTKAFLWWNFCTAPFRRMPAIGDWRPIQKYRRAHSTMGTRCKSSFLQELQAPITALLAFQRRSLVRHAIFGVGMQVWSSLLQEWLLCMLRVNLSMHRSAATSHFGSFMRQCLGRPVLIRSEGISCKT